MYSFFFAFELSSRCAGSERSGACAAYITQRDFQNLAAVLQVTSC